MAVIQTGSAVHLESTDNSNSQMVTVPSDAEIAVLLCTGYSGGAYFYGGTVTLGGSSMIQQVSTDVNDPAVPSHGEGFTAIYTITNPATGSQSLAWDWYGSSAAGEGINSYLVFYKNVDTSDAIRDSGLSVASDTDITGLDAESGDMMVGVIYCYVNLPVVTDNGQTQIAASEYHGAANSCAHKDGGTGFYYHDGTYPTCSAIIIRAAAAGTTLPTHSFPLGINHGMAIRMP